MDGIMSETLGKEIIKTKSEERLEIRTILIGNVYAKREHQRFEV
jgi:hypothetical protein